MGSYKELDYFKWAKEMDVISWDNYPAYDTQPGYTAMQHDLMRGLKDAPFMLMEQTPSQQNWQPYNSLKRPGQMRAQSLQTIAHGADTIQFSSSAKRRGVREIPWSGDQPRGNRKYESFPGSAAAWRRAGKAGRRDPGQPQLGRGRRRI